MTPEAEAAKARVLMDYPTASLGVFDFGTYFVFREDDPLKGTIGIGKCYEQAWLSADLANNKRIVKEMWPEAIAKKGEWAGRWNIFVNEHELLDLWWQTEPEAWLNARKVVRGEA